MKSLRMSKVLGTIRKKKSNTSNGHGMLELKKKSLFFFKWKIHFSLTFDPFKGPSASVAAEGESPEATATRCVVRLR